jgi:hypothetical protein
MPPLMVALRTLPASYEHVLEWLKKYSHSIFMYGWHSYSLEDMDERNVLLTVLR